MYSKQEAQQLKKEFWTAFGKSFPKKWIVYNTKIKDFSFKFFIDTKKASVSLDIEMKDEVLRQAYFDKILSLETILKEFIGDFLIEEEYISSNGKPMARVWVEMDNVSIYNKSTWQKAFEFFYSKMSQMELFFLEYEDYIKTI